MSDHELVFRVENQSGGQPVYRLWIDYELMCERTFWPDAAMFYIDETVIINLDREPHLAIFELVGIIPGKCEVKMLTIKDLDFPKTYSFVPEPMDGRRQTIKFQINKNGE